MQKNKKRAIVFGISGQTGSHLAELLLEKDYDVHGVVRRHSNNYLKDSNIGHLLDKITLYYGDMTDAISIQNAIIRSNPHEIYALAAQSHVQISYENPVYSANVIAIGHLNLLEGMRMYAKGARLVHASTSEMFGNSIDIDGFQRESSQMVPANPYACAKVFSHNVGRNYRESYNLFIANSIAMNHEGPRRGINFVTAKIVSEAVKISRGLADKLPLGCLSARRDFSHAKDIAKAQWMMLQHDKPDDWMVASGVSHSVEELCDYVFSKLGLNYKDYVVIDPKFIRPEETRNLRGDSSKIRSILGWQPEYTFESLMDEMIEHYQNVIV